QPRRPGLRPRLFERRLQRAPGLREPRLQRHHFPPHEFPRAIAQVQRPFRDREVHQRTVTRAASGRCGVSLKEASENRSPEKRNSETDEFRTRKASDSAAPSAAPVASWTAEAIGPAEVNASTRSPRALARTIESACRTRAWNCAHDSTPSALASPRTQS